MPPDPSTRREVDLIRAMADSPEAETQEALGSQLAALRMQRAADERARRSLDLAAAALPPGAPQYGYGVLPAVRTTAASDWLAHVESTRYDPADVAQRMVAAASLWYDRLPPAVRADQREYATQAEGMAHRHAGAWGEQAPEARRAFLDQAGHLGGLVLVADEYSQVPPGSRLPVGTDDEQTFDESMWGPAGGPDSQTQQGETPSLAEGGPIEGDVAEGIENPAADQPHDAGPGAGTQPATDYLDGTQVPPAAGTGMTTMNSLHPGWGSLISRRAQQVVADMAMTPAAGVAPMPSTHDDSLTPSQQMGPPPAPPVPATGALPVELGPHDAGSGNGPAIDVLDGTVSPWPGQAARVTRPLSAVAAQIRRHVGERVPPPARVFLDAMSMMGSGAEPFGQVPGREVVASFLEHAAAQVGPELVAELRAHLDPRVADGLPPWLKKKDDDKPDDDDKDDDEGSKDDSSDDDDDDEDDKDDDDAKSKKDDDCDDDDGPPSKRSSLAPESMTAPMVSFRARVQASLQAARR